MQVSRHSLCLSTRILPNKIKVWFRYIIILFTREIGVYSGVSRRCCESKSQTSSCSESSEAATHDLIVLVLSPSRICKTHSKSLLFVFQLFIVVCAYANEAKLHKTEFGERGGAFKMRPPYDVIVSITGENEPDRNARPVTGVQLE